MRRNQQLFLSLKKEANAQEKVCSSHLFICSSVKNTVRKSILNLRQLASLATALIKDEVRRNNVLAENKGTGRVGDKVKASGAHTHTCFVNCCVMI